MKYNVKVVYDQEDFISLMKISRYRKTSKRISGKISKVVLGIFGGYLILMGAIAIFRFIRGLIMGDNIMPIISIFIPIVFIAVGLYLILRDNTVLLGKIIWKIYKEKGYEIIYNFYPDHYTVYTSSGEHLLKYSILKSLYEDEKKYYLLVDSDIAHIINKAQFRLEDSKQFGIFITGKTGLDIIQIK